MTRTLRYLVTSLAAGVGCAFGGVIGFVLLALVLGVATRTGEGIGGVALIGMLLGAAGGAAFVGGLVWLLTRNASHENRPH
jgi:hypothetical protein